MNNNNTIAQRHVFAAVCQWKKPGLAIGRENVRVRYIHIFLLRFILFYCYFKCTFLSLEPMFLCFVYWWIIKIYLIWFDLKRKRSSLCSSSMLLSVHRDRTYCQGRPPPLLHNSLNMPAFHYFSFMLLSVHRDPRDCQGRPPPLLHSSLNMPAFHSLSFMLLSVHRDPRDCQGREPRTATSTVTQLLTSERKR